MAGECDEEREVGAAVEQELGDWIAPVMELGDRVEDGSLATDAGFVESSAGVDVRAAIEEETRGVDVAVFGGDVKQGGAAKRQSAVGRGTKVEFLEAPMHE